MKTDTIAAIATALSDSGIGIIRVSGDKAIEIADRLYLSKGVKKKLKDVKSHTIHYGYIALQNDSEVEILDEVMVSVMRAPKSYTTEDTVEINCHGGVLMMQRILEAVLKAGARLAEPGEFTKRAFLNGRMDLSEAEAVMDLIHAKSDIALKSSFRQLKGSVSEKIKSIREKIIYEIAFIESALDDPEHISLDDYPKKLSVKIKELSGQVDELLSSAENGKFIKEGIHTVIVGKPNAGKSSLLNLLVGEEKAIVTEIAGTTRDVLEEYVRLNGILLHLIDTAGIRSSEDPIERIGVEKAKKYAAEADLILYVADSSTLFTESDKEIINLIADKQCIILWNKTDLPSAAKEEELLSAFKEASKEEVYKMPPIVRTSAKDASGLDELEEKISKLFFHGKITLENEVTITNIRHKEALLEAKQSLQLVENSLAAGLPEDFYSIDLMSAYAALGSIIGEEVSDDLVEEIFSKFCMGK